MISIRQALDQAVSALKTSDSAKLDADVLLAFVLHKTRSYLFSHADTDLSEDQYAVFEALVVRRAAGEPVAYLTGQRGFWTLDLKVTPAVLIPRPETELLVELALNLGLEMGQETGQIMNREPGPSRAGPALTVADLGTGSGAIALALASERAHWHIYATDRSEQALQVARDNAVQLNLTQVKFSVGDWCEALPADTRFDMIISNPPYIDAGDPHLELGGLPFEPRTALVADSRGLSDLATICQQAGHKLREDGYLLLEHGYQQGAEVRALLATAGFRKVRSECDLAGHERVTLGQFAESGENTYA
ncbi:peptide chain release factor N(5)-glutamine methyltransferase [Pseudohongiella acticola]|jgi:release factor glutamine methyltransferase|uniref:peptide chain release factor N(5)-glutamine methyltransferase n=1 Tax=Pseudohongiella acticola TaxID=1524254 RepID=UPI0030EDC562